jgi:hypothetical protein
VARIFAVLALVVTVNVIDAGSASAQGPELRGGYAAGERTFKGERFQSKFQRGRIEKKKPRAQVPELGVSGLAAALALLGGAAAIAHGRRRARV